MQNKRLANLFDKRVFAIFFIVAFAVIGTWRLAYLAGASDAINNAQYQAGTQVLDSHYIIFSIGATYYDRNGYTGEVTYSTSNATAAIQYALNGLTIGRDYQEKVTLLGNFFIGDNQVRLPSYVILDMSGAVLYCGSSSAATDPIRAAGTSLIPLSHITLLGGHLIGNNIGLACGTYFSYVNNFTISGLESQNFTRSGIRVDDCKWGLIEKFNCRFNQFDGVSVFAGSRDSYNIKIIDGSADQNGQDGVYVDDYATYNSAQSGIMISDVYCRYNGIPGYGSRLDGVLIGTHNFGVIITNCHSRVNYADGIALTRDDHSVISACETESNGGYGVTIVACNYTILDNINAYNNAEFGVGSWNNEFGIFSHLNCVGNTVGGIHSSALMAGGYGGAVAMRFLDSWNETTWISESLG